MLTEEQVASLINNHILPADAPIAITPELVLSLASLSEEPELPSLDAPIVDEPEPEHLLKPDGMPHDADEYMACKNWNVKNFFDRRPVKEGRKYYFVFDVEWKDTWHQKKMIELLERYKWIPASINWNNPKYNEKYQVNEYRCTWANGAEKFENLSGFSQRLAIDKFGDCGEEAAKRQHNKEEKKKKRSRKRKANR